MNKHIRVELDFIPVEERLPDDKQSVFCLEILHMLPGVIVRDYAEYEEGRWLAVDGSGNVYVSVTHWAEIPEIDTLQDRRHNGQRQRTQSDC